MSTCTTKVALRAFVAALSCLSLQLSVFACQTDSSPSRMATYESAEGTTFALSVGPEKQTRQRASDVVVFLDTSASQTGRFKTSSMEMLKGFVGHLSADDRIQIFALDLDSVPLYRGFTSPSADEVKLALEKLDSRVALGSTDMQAMFKSAAKAFESSTDRNKNLIYIGDGISRAGLLHSDVYLKAVQSLAKNRISVSSYAIGPERNTALLASLANNTGGNLIVDADDTELPTRAAKHLAQTVHGSVFWPKTANLPASLVEIYPGKCPPMRTDRDTILLGALASRGEMKVELVGMQDGKEVTKVWNIKPEVASKKFSFLPKMLEEVRKDGGVSLPTLGSEGLIEYVRNLGEGGQSVENLGSGKASIRQAAVIASAARINPKTRTVPVRFQQDVNPFGADPFDEVEVPTPAQTDDSDPFGDDPVETEETPGSLGGLEPEIAPAQPIGPERRVVIEPASPTLELEIAPNQQQPNGGFPSGVAPLPSGSGSVVEGPVVGPSIPDFPRSRLSDLLSKPEADDVVSDILTAEERDRIINQKLRKQVQFEIERSSQELKTTPGAAISRIKSMLDVLDQTPEVNESTRFDLRNRLESALAGATREKLDFDQRAEIAAVNSAISQGVRDDIRALERREEKLSRLVGQFRSLMSEGNFAAAEEVAASVTDGFPDVPVAALITERARIASAHFELAAIRSEKQVRFARAIQEIRKTSYPISGNPPLIFPDPEEWIRKKAARRKFQSVLLAGSETDRRILEELEKPYDLIYDEQEFREVRERLVNDLKINIIVDPNLEGEFDDETLVTANLTGIRLRNGLRQLLKAYNATYVVKDEVLKIISIDDEGLEENLSTVVYNVGDLVAPRNNPQAGGGGGFGGVGGGIGGANGGFGGGQGAFGRGGGQGGVFCIQDAGVGFSFREAAPETAAPAAPVERVESIILETGDNPQAAWNNYFSNNQPSDASVRKTVRRLLQQERHEDIIALIGGAIRNNQGQKSWMYQAMGISLDLLGRPAAELERAIMSAVDLSNDPQEVMLSAIYMSHNGMEQRALKIFEDISKSNPDMVEPAEVALTIADRLNMPEAQRWSSVAVLSREWPEKQALVKKADFATAAVRAALKKSGSSEELEQFEKELVDARHRDCHIKVSWTGDADIDILVEEPGGTICSRLNPRTTAGGVHHGDNYSRGKLASGEQQETYVLPKGFTGDYRLIVRRMTGTVPTGKVKVSMAHHRDSEFEVGLEKYVDLDERGAIVKFRLERGRRTDDLEKHTLETLVRKKTAIDRSILTQQLAQGFPTQSLSNANVFGSQLGLDDGVVPGQVAPGGGQFAPGVVGYTPEITTIPTGTFLTVNHATTADRLYVLISVAPNFNTITSVETFNLLGDADSALGAAQPGLGGNGAGFGGGGGGFGNGGAGGNF